MNTKNHKRIFSFFVVLFLSLSLGGCHVPLLDKEITIPFFEKKGDEAFRLSMEAMEKIKSYSFNDDLNIEINFKEKELSFLSDEIKDDILAMINEGSPKVLGIDNVTEENNINPMPLVSSFPKNISISYKSKGKADKRDENNQKSEFNTQLNIDFGGTKFEADIEVVVIDSAIYAKFVKVPNFIDSLLAGMDFALGDKWWKFDLKESNSLSKNIPFEVEVTTEENLKQTKKKLSSLMKNNPIIKIDERLKDDKINGEKNYHFKSSINALNLTKLTNEFSSISQNDIQVENEIVKSQKESIEKRIKSLSDFMTKSDIDIWINKKSFDMRKTIFNFSFDTSKLQTNDAITPDSYGLIDVMGSVEYADIGKEMNIKAPENSDNFFELISKKLEEAKIKSRDARRLADAKQIQTALELYYSDNGNFPKELKYLVESNDLQAENEIKKNYGYLFDLPKDPKPNKECGEEFDYSYSVKDAEQDFDLSFCLEEGIGKYQKGTSTFNSMMASSTRVEILEAKTNIQGAMLDSDNDGLNDFEEEMVYFTDLNNPDTDSDGFSDGDEVRNGYNPLGEGKLSGQCFADSDCEKYISYNSCEVLCIYRNTDKSVLDLETVCNDESWNPPVELNCACLNNECVIK